MQKTNKQVKTKGVVKGAPSGVIISLALHAAAFLLAGLLVVFTVVNKEEKKFVPPKPVDRPKMKLKKPQVKVKKTARPKSTTRIVTKVKRADMPDIQLPEMSGMGAGLGGGLSDGFNMMPDLNTLSIMGSTISSGNDLEGLYYDTKRGRDGRMISASLEDYRYAANSFMRHGWDKNKLSRFYRAPHKLYASSIVIPETDAAIVPLSFGDETGVGAFWLVHYEGQLVHKDGIKFRFYGTANEFMVVRVGGEIVLGACWNDDRRGEIIGNLWESTSADSDRWYWGRGSVEVGDWITLEPGVPLPMEVLLGDNGWSCGFVLAVEVDGVEYEKSPQGAPTLPVFKTAELSRDYLDKIYREQPEGEICFTNGPVFNDFYTPPAERSPREEVVSTSVEQPKKPLAPAEGISPVRIWTLEDGRSFEGALITTMGKDYVLKSNGKQIKIPASSFSGEDKKFVDLSNPPSLEIDFIRNLNTVTFSEGWYGEFPRAPEQYGNFGLRIKQTSAGEYQHQLKAEMFVVAQQLGVPDKKCFLIDHQTINFKLDKTNKRRFQFMSDRQVRLTDWTYDTSDSKAFRRGEIYYAYLIAVVDARGEAIAVQASKSWLEDNLENLRKLKIGNFLDEQCLRCYPGRPVPLRW